MNIKNNISLSSLVALTVFIAPQATTAYSNNTLGSSGQSAVHCPVDNTWLTQPSLPTEVKKSGADGSSNFCDFYQFSTQTYLYLMSEKSPGVRNFQDSSQYPLLEHDSATGNPVNSCDDTVLGTTLNTSLSKSSLSTGQAGGGATIYDQAGNVVYYDVRFDKNTCNTTGSAVKMNNIKQINFPSGTTELKFAWKVLTKDEITAGKHITQAQELNGNTVTMGLLGMHIAVATTDHPEFVWASYEHKTNSPDCVSTTPQAGTNWTFASNSCTEAIDNNDTAKIKSCAFNSPLSNQTSPTGTPTNICRVYPYGTDPSDLKAADNITDIKDQNSGLDDLLAQNSAPKNMKVLTNYFNIGALWVSDITQSSGGANIPNERGSLRLANSVAETDYQHVDTTSNFASNCFGCHNYVGTGKTVNNNITSQALSHIFKEIKVGQGLSIDVTASSVIGSNSEAPKICGGDPNAKAGTSARKGTCASTASYLKWNGNWTNINQNAGSVCGCSLN